MLEFGTEFFFLSHLLGSLSQQNCELLRARSWPAALGFLLRPD